MQAHLVLKKYFEKKKTSSGTFSLRVLSKQTQISPSFLSRVLSGKKPLPYAVLLVLGPALDIEQEVFSRLKAEYMGEPLPSHPKTTKRPRGHDGNSALNSWELAEKPQFDVLRQWFYLPILEFTTLKEFDGSAEMIARRLGLSLTTVEIALRELAGCGLLAQQDGCLRKCEDRLRWSSAKPLPSIRLFHDRMMTKAQELLRKEPSETDFAGRFISGVTLTASPDKIASAKQKIAEYIHELAGELMNDEGTEVYQLSVQLFPLTK